MSLSKIPSRLTDLFPQITKEPLYSLPDNQSSLPFLSRFPQNYEPRQHQDPYYYPRQNPSFSQRDSTNERRGTSNPTNSRESQFPPSDWYRCQPTYSQEPPQELPQKLERTNQRVIEREIVDPNALLVETEGDGGTNNPIVSSNINRLLPC